MSDEPLRRTLTACCSTPPPASRQTESVLWRLRRGGKNGRCWRKRSGCAPGLDILIGVAETHGRKETAAMLQGPEHPAAAAACPSRAVRL